MYRTLVHLPIMFKLFQVFPFLNDNSVLNTSGIFVDLIVMFNHAL